MNILLALENFNKLKQYYNTVLNIDPNLVETSNDEPTPIECVEEILDKLPLHVWSNIKLKWFDPCCGCGNFFIVVVKKLMYSLPINNEDERLKHILEKMLYFNDINEKRLSIVNTVFIANKYKLNITMENFLEYDDETSKYDVFVVNPPYAKLLDNGKRASKNHNLIGPFIRQSFKMLNPRGYLVYITPDNWMSLSDRNTLIKDITSKQIIHLDIHTAKKYFKKIGSSFTWYIIENTDSYKNITIKGIQKKIEYTSSVKSATRSYIPLYYNSTIQSILSKTIDNDTIVKFNVETTSDLHKYTKKNCISSIKDDIFKYKLHHTPTQTVWANRPHKFQDGYKLFIGTTSYYNTFVDNCGMTQSIAFIRCSSEQQAKNYKKILDHDLYKFINNICRWGNFNNVRILQKFPMCNDIHKVYDTFNINEEEQQFISLNL